MQSSGSAVIKDNDNGAATDADEADACSQGRVSKDGTYDSGSEDRAKHVPRQFANVNNVPEEGDASANQQTTDIETGQYNFTKRRGNDGNANSNTRPDSYEDISIARKEIEEESSHDGKLSNPTIPGGLPEQIADVPPPLSPSMSHPETEEYAKTKTKERPVILDDGDDAPVPLCFMDALEKEDTAKKVSAVKPSFPTFVPNEANLNVTAGQALVPHSAELPPLTDDNRANIFPQNPSAAASHGSNTRQEMAALIAAMEGPPTDEQETGRIRTLPIYYEVPEATLVVPNSTRTINNNQHQQEQQQQQQQRYIPTLDAVLVVPEEPPEEQPWWKQNRLYIVLCVGLVLGALIASITVAAMVRRDYVRSSSTETAAIEITENTRATVASAQGAIGSTRATVASIQSTVASAQKPSASPTESDESTIGNAQYTNHSSPQPITETGATMPTSISSHTEPNNLPIPPTPPETPTLPVVPNIPQQNPTESSCVKYIAALLGMDCVECYPRVAIGGNIIVIGVNNTLHFREYNDGSFDKETLLEFDHSIAAVAISGNTAVVGIPSENDSVGAAYIYEKDGQGLWNQIVHIIPDELLPNAQFGSFLDIDGNVIVISTNGGQGNAHIPQLSFIYRRAETGLVYEATLDQSGESVSIQGNTIVLGYKSQKKVFVYKMEPSWIEESQIDTGVHSTLSERDCDGGYGSSLALTDNGNELFVGCSKENSDTGQIYYYRQDHGGEYIMLQTIQAWDGTKNDDLGDTNQIAVGHVGNGTSYMAAGTYRVKNGSVYIFKKIDSGQWSEVARVDALAKTKHFGDRIAMSGERLIVSSGHNAFLYTLEGC
mmetsp:Transcript_22626/g.47677  ORF Transcript_22626/g.47677 Transcript_22626/m.47677 type:complete len:832 (-) Transcript_22626:667-3162(-)|eukprot:CAMPEP_0183742910 /NCGR_PEP_ID=MMETSP0737-20130205/64941_1 /TAXON_ID=385413 /ORGANISM="Thalassiosira miniscula, Strain CCMP1093" /LENGTH=831 /DNA_ID=CAMNT_0025978509 /DNA_START=82 /DNA_END=2577 /DNA_ORIENTATION=+